MEDFYYDEEDFMRDVEEAGIEAVVGMSWDEIYPEDLTAEELNDIIDGEFDTCYTSVPMCPHCGYEDEDWADGIFPDIDGECIHTECDDCGKSYVLESNISISFSTYK